MNYSDWFLDFDDTLATGAFTWGYTGAFPKLIEENALPYEPVKFKTAFMIAQRHANIDPNPLPPLGMLFETMGWPLDLRFSFLDDLQANYQATLFDDTLPFLTRLAEAKKRVFIISNNPSVLDMVDALGITEYITDIITPRICENCKPKPNISLWNYAKGCYPTIQQKTSIMVGDDTWSDAAFAKNCGITCSLLDRLSLLHYSETVPKCTVISSLDALTIE